MATYKLAELLLRRKELHDQVERMKPINIKDLFEVKLVRRQVNEQYDDFQATVPRLTYEDFSAEYNYYSHQLRLVDGLIQQANWSTEVVSPEDVTTDYISVSKPPAH